MDRKTRILKMVLDEANNPNEHTEYGNSSGM